MFREQVNRKKREEEAAKKEEEEQANKAAEEGPGQEGALQPDAPANPSSEAVPKSEAGCVLMSFGSSQDGMQGQLECLPYASSSGTGLSLIPVANDEDI